MSSNIRKSIMLATTAVAALAAIDVGAAQAQAANGDAVQEVVVTATRRSDTVHNIPLSITAVTNETLEVQGLKSAQDVARTVPALRVGPANGAAAGGQAIAGADVAIRGIRGGAGASTTGIYIDDIPLQQRTLIAPAGGGVAFPQLFDLDRIEVLRGPQGTLYGGSSEGGTIRFITRQPSFNKYTAYVRGEASTTEHGDASYEAGLSVGGPIVADKLAFMLTGWTRKDGGYIDHISRFSGKSVGDDTNSATHHLMQAKLLWKPTERATVTLGYFYSDNRTQDTDQYWADIPQYSSNVGPSTPAQPNGKFYTYGPYKYGPYTSGQNTNVGDQFYTSDAQIKPLLAKHYDYTRIPSLTLDYDFDKMSVKLVSSFLDLTNHSYPNFAYVDIVGRGATPIFGANPVTGFAGFNAPVKSGFIANLPVYDSQFDQAGRSRSLTEELRFSSNDPESPLSWVAGIYFNSTRDKTRATIQSNFDDVAAAVLFGISRNTPTKLNYITQQGVSETQLAGFGEATYKITDKVRVTGGIRYTRDEFSYTLRQGGALFQLPDTPILLAQGSVTESPITPKVGLQYVLDSNTNFYVTASKGYRPGGVNQPITSVCTTFLTAAGYPNGAPATYGSDTLWSYEGGAKLRGWNGRATLNASAYRIDWNDVQTNIALNCGQSFATNAAKVRSQGVDLDASVRIFPGFTVSGALAYTDAKYQGDVRTSPTAILIGNGDRVPYTPKWSGSISAQYNFELASLPTYIRADYQFQGSFVQGTGPTTLTYSPDSYTLPGTDFISARAGIKIAKVDLSVFVDNLTASKDLLGLTGLAAGPGRISCLNGPSCTVFAGSVPVATPVTFRPRTWGISASYRY